MVRYYVFTVHLLSHCHHLSCCTIQLPYSTAAVLVFNSCQCQLPASTSCQCLCQTAAIQYYSTLLTLLYTYLNPEAESLDEIQAKVLRVFLLAIHSHLFSFALRFLFLQNRTTSYSFYSSVTVLCKGERRKTWQKAIPGVNLTERHTPFLWFKKSKQNLKSENSRYYSQKPQRNCTFLNSASGLVT